MKLPVLSVRLRSMSRVFPVLTTPRLQLRQLVPSDGAALFAIHSDAEWMKWYGTEPMNNPHQAVELAELFSAWFAAETGYRWALQREADNTLLGTCGLFRWNKNWRNCLVSYEIARAFQGQGYMREALEAVIDYGFASMGLHRIQAETHPDNAASIRLAVGMGFRREGVHRDQAFWGGRFHDLNCYSLLEADWRARAGRRDAAILDGALTK